MLPSERIAYEAGGENRLIQKAGHLVSDKDVVWRGSVNISQRETYFIDILFVRNHREVLFRGVAKALSACQQNVRV